MQYFDIVNIVILFILMIQNLFISIPPTMLKILFMDDYDLITDLRLEGLDV